MMKRMLPLVAITILVLMAAPNAVAAPCFRCRFLPPPHLTACMVVTSGLSWENCFYDETGCYLSPPLCTYGFAMAPLADEFRVASVERLDEPQPPATPQVASLDETKAIQD